MSYKQLTPENWLQPDPAFLTSVQITVQDFLDYAMDPGPLLAKLRPVMVKPEDWIRVVHQPVLEAKLPEDLRNMFEAARGILVYGYCFYPLCTLAVEQLYRVFEAAVSMKCDELKCPSSIRTLQDKLGWLTERGLIPAEESNRLNAIRHLRNLTSHPGHQMIVPPHLCGQEFADIAATINHLFR